MATGLDLLMGGASAPQSGLDVLMAPQASAAPTKAKPYPGWMSQLGDAAAAFGHHSANALHGTAQFIENGVAAGANLLPDNPISRAISATAASDNRALADREAAYQKTVPNSAGAYAGATAGEVLPWLVGGVPKGLMKAGDAVASLLPQAAPKLLQKTASAATQGAIAGATAPVATSPTLSDVVTGQQPSYWDQKARDIGGGAAVGGAIPGVAAGIGGVYGAVKNAAMPIVNPKGVVAPMVAKLIGDDPATLAKLLGAPDIVPGSKPTLAQLLATPESVSAEKALTNTSPAFKVQMADRANANNEARMAAIQGVAQTPQDLAAALKTRSDTTRPMIDSLLTNGKPVDAAPVLSQLQALQTSSLGTDPVVKKGVADLIGNIQQGVTDTGQGGTLIRPDLLDGHRQNVRNVLQQYASNGAVGTKQEAAFEPVRAAIVDSIDGANPGYRDYLAAYAKSSQPINTMEAAGGILDHVGGDSRSLNSAGVPQVTLTRYASALAKALKGPYDMDPAARASLEAVQSDLQRESISSSIRTPGSDTAANLQAPGWLAGKLYGDNFSGTPSAAKLMGSVLGGIGGYVGGGIGGGMGGSVAGAAAMNKVGQLGQSRVNELLAKALSDPEFAAQLAAQVQPPKGPGMLSGIPQASLLGL